MLAGKKDATKWKQVSIGTVMGCYKSRHGTIDVRQHGFTSLTAFFESMSASEFIAALRLFIPWSYETS